MTDGEQECEFRVPLVGCDGFLLALEDLMETSGQGRHVGLTVLKLGAEFSVGSLRSAAERFSRSHPLLHARVARSWMFGVPEWQVRGPFAADGVFVEEHSGGVSLEDLCERLLQLPTAEALRFDVIPGEGCTWIVVKWLHLLFDGRGIELALHEIARLAEHPGEVAAVQRSWGAVFGLPKTFRERWLGVRAFVQRYNHLKGILFESAGGVQGQSGRARFKVLHFDQEQSRVIRERAEHLTGGIFLLPVFFAVVARAHAAVFEHRGQVRMDYYAGAPVQGRKRGAKHPIFQNQISQFYFGLTHDEVASLETATRSIHAQFGAMARGKVEGSFFIMLQWLLRLPERLYMEFLRRDTRGQLTSFFQSHTGQFMPETQTFCGAQILDGWHIPTVSAPPGSGMFFSERARCLSVAISWREGVLSDAEVDVMCVRLRQDLLGDVK